MRGNEGFSYRHVSLIVLVDTAPESRARFRRSALLVSKVADGVLQPSPPGPTLSRQKGKSLTCLRDVYDAIMVTQYNAERWKVTITTESSIDH